MIEQMGLSWEQEIALTAAQAKEAEFTRNQRTLLLKQFEQRFHTVSEEISRQVEAANLAALTAALGRLWEIKDPEDLLK